MGGGGGWAADFRVRDDGVRRIGRERRRCEEEKGDEDEEEDEEDRTRLGSGRYINYTSDPGGP